MKENTLFIGNGLNRCLESSISWGNLLEDIANEFGIETFSDIPLPLEFERLINEKFKKDKSINQDIFDIVKRKIANKVSNISLPETAIHREIKKIKINSIITTNYDLLLEKVFDIDSVAKVDSKKKYLMEKIASKEKVDFFHPHGFIEAPSTMCLGYEHYMGMVEHIRPKVNSKRINDNEEKLKNIERILRKYDESNGYWMEKFYTDNLFIFGFGLDFCESDIWWVLTHRASLFFRNDNNIREVLNNNVFYYDVDVKEESSTESPDKCRMKNRKYQMLSALNVNVKVKEIKCSGNNKNEDIYIEGYKKIFEYIREDIKNYSK